MLGLLLVEKYTGNWRITFRFVAGLAEDLNLEDYHVYGHMSNTQHQPD